MFRRNGSNCDSYMTHKRNCPPFYSHFFFKCKLIGKSLKQGALPSSSSSSSSSSFSCSSSSSSSSSSMFFREQTWHTAPFCTGVCRCCACFWPHTSSNNVFIGQYPINVIYNMNIKTHFSSLKAFLSWSLATCTHLLHLAPGNYSDRRPSETRRYIIISVSVGLNTVWDNVSTQLNRIHNECLDILVQKNVTSYTFKYSVTFQQWWLPMWLSSACA